MSLRLAFTIAMITLGALAVSVAVMLVVLTTRLHRTTEALGTAMQSVWIIEEMEIDLQAHARALEPDRGALEASLKHRLLEAEDHVTDAEERQKLEKAKFQIERYLQLSRQAAAPYAMDPAGLEQAFQALEALVETNVQQAAMVQERARKWNHLGNVFGISAAVVLLVIVAALITWIPGFALRPVLQIRNAMRTFSEGTRGARAPEQGPTELRSIARQFNEMAATLERQQVNQLAFLGGVAHDLRNPLSALKLSTAIIAPDRPLPPEYHIRETVSLVKRQVGLLERMVGDFLDASRIEAGKLELRFEVLDLREIARAVFDLYQAGSPSHPMKLSVPPHAVQVRCDPLRIEQVLNNLLSNAIKYSPGGGEVEVSVESEGKEACLRVSDRGIGISPEDIEHIFEPFRRASASRGTIPGVGLGLSVVRRIVEAHGGKMDVESAAGQGTVFRVKLEAGA